MADVPGLIEGAAQGKGLGHDFLRHIERTALIVHVIDATGGFEGRDPVEDYRIINAELAAHAQELAERPQIVVANKCDMPGVSEGVAALKAAAEASGHPFFAVSAVTGEGLETFKRYCAHEVHELRAELAAQQDAAAAAADERTWRDERARRDRAFHIDNLGGGVWRITGTRIERMVVQTDWDNEEAVTYLQLRFSKMGLDDALAKAGAVTGDEVRILGYSFDYEGEPTFEDEEFEEDLGDALAFEVFEVGEGEDDAENDAEGGEAIQQ
jgi:GTP-binding protein